MKFLIDKFTGNEDLGLEHIFQFLADKDYKNASELLKEIIPIIPDEVKNELYTKIQSTYNTADFKGCLVLGEAIINGYSTDHDLLNKLGNCQRRLKNRREANKYYKASLQAKKNFSTAFNNLAASLAKIHRFDEEIPILLKSIERFKDFIVPDYIPIQSIKARRRITEILFHKRQSNENDQVQELLLEKSLKFQKGHLSEIRGLTQKIIDKLKKNLPETLTRDEYEKVLKEIVDHDWDTLSDAEKEILEIEVYNYGIDYLKNRQPQKSIKNFKKLKERGCPFEYVDLMLGLSEYLCNRDLDGLKTLKKYYEKYPNDRYVNINLGMAYREQKNKLLSTKHLLKAAAIFEKLEGLISPSKILKRGQSLIDAGKKDKAFIFIETAYRELKSKKSLFVLGKLQLDLDFHQDALHSFEELIFRFPEFNKAEKEMEALNAHFFKKGEVYFAKGEIEKSLEKYQLALRAKVTEETLKKLLICYRRLKQREKSVEINLELEKLQEKKRKEKESQKIQELVQEGKNCFRRRKYQKAIEYFEDALEIRPDKGVFVFLAHIYKLLNRKHALAILVRTYRPMFSQDNDLSPFDGIN